MEFKSFLRRRGAGQSGTSRAGYRSRLLCYNQVHTICISDSDVNKQDFASRRCGSSPVAPSLHPPAPLNAKVHSIDAVPTYVQDLVSSRDPGGERTSRTLRKLFAVSQIAANPESRNEDSTGLFNGGLIPALLAFLGRCERGSSEQSTALLILNNLSIPEENKRAIAIDFDGAKILCLLLVEDPSNHLVAIVLVNLTFADPELRSTLVSQGGDVQLIESLSFALRVASLTRDEYAMRRPRTECDPVYDDERASMFLVTLLAEDLRQPSSLEAYSKPLRSVRVPAPGLQLYPETVRWCLAALKNLTRPTTDPTAACSLIKVGIVPHILEFLRVDSQGESCTFDREPILVESLPVVRLGSSYSRSTNKSLCDASNSRCSFARRCSRTHESSTCDSDSNETPVPSDPEAETSDCFSSWNSPAAWDDKSAQDAALFIILNLSTFPLARDYIREIDAVRHLFAITASETKPSCGRRHTTAEALSDFQRLKARMALSYLLGSDGPFDFKKHRGIGKKVIYASRDDIALMVHETEVTRIVELLANTIHRRSKTGAGGYSAATFSTKHVLLGLRRLLAGYENQVKMADTLAPQINSLLLKAVAIHAFHHESHIDAEAAEYACFSLYLLSSYCFQANPFLPALFGDVDVTKSLVAKVLTAYSNSNNTPPAGKHAASQIRLRLKYLVVSGTAAQLAATMGGSGTSASDFTFGPSLRAKCQDVTAANPKVGARPDENIFDRPILRRRIPRHFKRSRRLINWKDNEEVDFFPNVVQAAEAFSFNSTEIRHLGEIDDILVANNIAHSANGEKTESYNYMWSWQDTASEIQRHLEHQQSSDSFLSFAAHRTGGEMHSIDFIDTLCGS